MQFFYNLLLPINKSLAPYQQIADILTFFWLILEIEQGNCSSQVGIKYYTKLQYILYIM